MATQRDVNLVIKARDEASKAFDAATRAIENLVTNAASGKTGFEQMASSLLTLDKAVATFTGKYDAASQGIARQAAQIADYQSRLSGLKGQMDGAAAAAEKLRVAIVETKLNGGDTSLLISQLQTVEATMRSLGSESGKLQRQLGAAQVSYTQGADALSAYERNLRGLGSAATFAKQEAEQVTASLERQAAAAERAAGVMSTVRRATDATTGKSAEESASVFQRSGLTDLEQQIALTEKLAQSERDRAAAQRMDRARASFNGAQDDGSGSVRASSTALADLLRQEEEAAKAADKQAAAVQRLRDRVDPLAAIIRNLATETAKLDEMQRTGAIDADLHAKALALLKAEADRAARNLGTSGIDSKGRPSLFGLTPNQMQNFGYQINDVVTQLASGTSLAQTLAQQGGQIIQIFPKIGNAIVAALSNPYIIAATAGITALALGVKHAADEAQNLRQYQGILSTMADGASHSAKSLEEAAKAFDRYGMSAEDAVAAVRTFLRDGVDDRRMVQFGRAASDLATVMGVDLKQATADVGKAFTGNYDAISKLDDQYNFLTATQREQIRTLFEEGKAGDARNMALNIFTQKMGGAAQQMRGPWSDAVRELKGAWGDLLDSFSKTTGITLITEAIDGLGAALTKLLQTIRGTSGAADVAKQIADKQVYIAELERNIRNNPNDTLSKARLADAQRGLETLQKQLQTAKDIETAKNGGTGDTRANGPNSAETKQSNDTLHEMDRENALQNLREKGADAIDNLRHRNEKYLSEAEQRRRIALAGELASVKAIGDERVKQAARQNAEDDERRKIQKEQEAYDAASSTPAMAARRLIMERETFRSQAYWDVNHYRVGFGSDTTTSAGGAVNSVTAGTSVSYEAALRDLDRRIGEFQNGIKTLIGSDRFNAFTSQQQAVLTSVAYNYGTLARTRDGHGAGIADIVRSGSVDQIAEAIRALGSDNNGVNRARRNREADLFQTPNAAIDASNEKQLEDAQQRQSKLNESISQGNKERERQTAELEKQNKLQGEALVQEQIRAAGDKAVADLQRRVDEQNASLKPYEKKLELTQQQIEATRKSAEEEARAQQAAALAQARTTDAERQMSNLTSQRDAIKQQIDALRSVGRGAEADALVPKLQGVNVELRKAIDQAIKFYEALDPKSDPLHRTQEQIDAIVTRMKSSQVETTNWTNILGVSGETIARTFSSEAVSAIDKFSQAVAEGKNVFTSLKDAFLQFASDFLRQIAQMILQQLIFNAISSWLGGGIGGGGGGSSVGVAHGGGVVGGGLGTNRSASPAWFQSAMRFHTGGIPGLGPDEVPLIAKKNEEIITRDDPRHRFNGGASGGASVPPIKVINAIDAGDMVSKGLASKVGEKAFLNFIRDNPGAVKQALG